jgi:hypothetical protein
MAIYGQAQLRPSDLQKGELLDQVLTLPLDILPPSVGTGHLSGEALEVCLGHISGLAHILELALKKGDPPSELVGLLMNRDQQGSVLLLHLQHPFPGRPLN